MKNIAMLILLAFFGLGTAQAQTIEQPKDEKLQKIETKSYVQDQLGISDADMATVEKIENVFEPTFTRLKASGMNSTEMKTKVDEVHARMIDKLSYVLNEEQLKKYQELKPKADPTQSKI